MYPPRILRWRLLLPFLVIVAVADVQTRRQENIITTQQSQTTSSRASPAILNSQAHLYYCQSQSWISGRRCPGLSYRDGGQAQGALLSDSDFCERLRLYCTDSETESECSALTLSKTLGLPWDTIPSRFSVSEARLGAISGDFESFPAKLKRDFHFWQGILSKSPKITLNQMEPESLMSGGPWDGGS